MYATKEYVDRVETMLAMKLRMVKEDIAAMSGTVVDIQLGQRRLESKADSLETKVDGLENKVDGLESKVDGLEAKVDGLGTNLRAIMDHLGVPALHAPRQVRGEAE